MSLDIEAIMANVAALGVNVRLSHQNQTIMHFICGLPMYIPVVEARKQEIVSLLKAVVKKRPDLWITDDDGMTCLHRAAQVRNSYAIQLIDKCYDQLHPMQDWSDYILLKSNRFYNARTYSIISGCPKTPIILA